MGLKPDLFINKFMYFHQKRKLVNEFVGKMTTINEVFEKQMVFVQSLYENFANKYKQNIPNCTVNDEI